MPVAAMLLAALALVFHGGARALAHPIPVDRAPLSHIHSDCASHHSGTAGEPDAGLRQAHGPAHVPTPEIQLDCCAAVCAAVLPLASSARLIVATPSRGVRPQPGARLEGLAPTAPTKPPRTSYQI